MLSLVNNVSYYKFDDNYFRIEMHRNNQALKFSNKIFNGRSIKGEIIKLNWKDKMVEYSNNKKKFSELVPSDIHPKLYDILLVQDETKYFVKPEVGSLGKGIEVLNGKEIKKKYDEKDKIIIQKCVESDLYEGYKYDVRMYYLLIRIKNKIVSYVSVDGKIRICEKIDDLITNSSLIETGIEKDGLKIKDRIQNSVKDFCSREDVVKIYDVIKRMDVCVKDKLRENDSVEGKNDFINMYGVDLIKDNLGKYWLIEINGNPNWYHKNDNKKLSELKKCIFEDIKNVVLNNYCDKKKEINNWLKI